MSRVYSNEQRSNIVRLNHAELPEPKHLFSIVNSQNNERMFFADKVVLVEGISDQVFFDAVFQQLGVTSGTTRAMPSEKRHAQGYTSTSLPSRLQPTPDEPDYQVLALCA